MKTYVIILSKQFPQGHRHSGMPTRFRCAYLQGRELCSDCITQCNYDEDAIQRMGRTCSRNLWKYRKIHTIRANYALWEKRIREIERAEACLSIRQWSGKPYRSPQIEIGRLTRTDGVGIQKLEIYSPFAIIIDSMLHTPELEQELAHNDGLSIGDWRSWFRDEDNQPMAIIHFTDFRYK